MKETYEVGSNQTITVTIEVNDSRRSDYPSELDWAAVRAERDRLKEDAYRRERQIKGLETRVGYLTDRTTDSDHRLALQIDEVANPLRARIKDLEAEVDRLKTLNHNQADTIKDMGRRLIGYDHDRYTERGRADKAQDRVAELERQLAKSVDRESELETKIENLDQGRIELDRRMKEARKETGRKIAELARQVGDLTADLASEKGKVEIHAKVYRDGLMAREQLLTQARTRIDEAKRVLTTDMVRDARELADNVPAAVLADAIRNALDALEA